MGSDSAAYRRIVSTVLDRFDATSFQQKYPAIHSNFSKKQLSKYSDEGPFYGHFMLWRLATVRDTQLQRLDALLETAASLRGWGQEKKSLVGSTEFGEFWSLVWQLQIAEYLLGYGFDLEWDARGPDLVARQDGEMLFVECYAPRSTFDVEVFLEEILRELHPQLRVWHQIFCKVVLPRNAAFERFLASLITWLDEPGRLPTLLAQADQEWPVLVPLPTGTHNVFVYIEGPSGADTPGILPPGGCCPEQYLERTLQDAVLAKIDSNSLRDRHPNVLAVNFLLGDDQLSMRVATPKAPDLCGVIDELVCGTIGIDKAISPGQLHCLSDARFREQWFP